MADPSRMPSGASPQILHWIGFCVIRVCVRREKGLFAGGVPITQHADYESKQKYFVP